MSLVKTLGGMTLEEFLDRVSSKEIAMWRAYTVLEDEDYEHQKTQARVVNSVKS